MEKTIAKGWRAMGSFTMEQLFLMQGQIPGPDWSDEELKLPIHGYEKGGNRVLVAQEPRVAGGPRLWHLSISREERYPGWDEIKSAREAFLPLGLTFVMYFPRLDEYVNVHPNCFHLWESTDPNDAPAPKLVLP